MHEGGQFLHETASSKSPRIINAEINRLSLYSFHIFDSLTIHWLSQHAQTVIMIGSQSTDLSRLKINTIGCLPSGSCHRLHSLKPNPDPGCACVTQPGPEDHMDTTPHAIRPVAITTSHSPDHKIVFTFGSTSFHAQITVSRSKV